MKSVRQERSGAEWASLGSGRDGSPNRPPAPAKSALSPKAPALQSQAKGRQALPASGKRCQWPQSYRRDSAALLIYRPHEWIVLNITMGMLLLTGGANSSMIREKSFESRVVHADL